MRLFLTRGALALANCLVMMMMMIGMVTAQIDSPTESPIVDTFPPTAEGGCYTNLDAVFYVISDDDRLLEQKTFVICPNTTLDIGFLVPGVGIDKGQAPIVPRSNSEFLCGANGSAENNCVIRGGDFGLIAVPVFFRQDLSLNNVLIKGFTFKGQVQYGAFMATEGQNVKFENCIFRDTANFGPVVMNYDSTLDLGRRTLEDGKLEEEEEENDDNPWDHVLDYVEKYRNSNKNGKVGGNKPPTRKLAATAGDQEQGHQRGLQPESVFQVEFKECLFVNLQQVERALGVEFGIVSIKGPDHNVTFDECTFANNQYGNNELTPIGYAIQVQEAMVNLHDVCLIDNDFRGNGAVLLEATANPFQNEYLTLNYASPQDEDLDCTFAAWFETDEDRRAGTYTCVEPQVDECGGEAIAGMDLASSPVAAPTAATESDGDACFDTPGWTDSFGDTCAWWEANSESCSSIGDSYEATTHCCACGGGSTGAGGDAIMEELTIPSCAELEADFCDSPIFAGDDCCVAACDTDVQALTVCAIRETTGADRSDCEVPSCAAPAIGGITSNTKQLPEFEELLFNVAGFRYNLGFAMEVCTQEWDALFQCLIKDCPNAFDVCPGFAETEEEESVAATLEEAPPGSSFFVDYRARFKRIVDDGCDSPTSESVAVVCEKGSIEIDTERTSDGIICTPPEDYQTEGEFVACLLTCSGTGCDDLYIDRESFEIFGIWIMNENFAEIYFTCSGDNENAVDATYLISGSEASGETGTCTAGTGTGEGQNLLLGELNVECPAEGTSGLEFVNSHAYSECGSGPIPLNVNGNYTCLTGDWCNDSDCLVEYEDVLIEADHHRFQMCIQTDPPGYLAPEPVVTVDDDIFQPSPGQYTARFQVGTEFWYDEDKCVADNPGVHITCVDGTIELISESTGMLCETVSDSEIECTETVPTVRNEPVDVAEYECTSIDVVPQTRVEYLSTEIGCASSSQEQATRYVNLGVLCGDPGDQSYVTRDVFFECAEDNEYTIRTDDLRFSCYSRVQVPEFSSNSDPLTIPPAQAFTDYRWAFFSSDICYSYKPGTTSSTARLIKKAHTIKKVAKATATSGSRGETTNSNSSATEASPDLGTIGQTLLGSSSPGGPGFIAGLVAALVAVSAMAMV